jgi:16S rRNA (uracil1498-N3)-methyltransferase
MAARSIGKRGTGGDRQEAPGGERWYWAERVDLEGGRLWLAPEEARHVKTVLRHRTGDAIQVIDGRGGRYSVALRPAGREYRAQAPGLEAEILVAHPRVPPPIPAVLVVPMIRWPRLEALIDGASELGVTELLLWRAARGAHGSTLSPIRRDRLERIGREAVTQSLGVHAPAIRGPLDLHEVGQALASFTIFVAQGDQAGETALPPATPGVPGGPWALIVGPEGGLAPEEIERFRAAGAHRIGLGARRLRTEVAALVGLSLLLARGRPGEGWLLP